VPSFIRALCSFIQYNDIVYRFLLAPPSSFTYTGLYPSLHPYFRQTPLDVYNDESDSLLSSLASSSSPSSGRSLVGQRVPVLYEVTLNPGDVLYLPPFWLHRVTALDVSISVNAWCPCKEFGIINGVNEVALPFDDHWNDLTLRTAVRRFITLVLNTVAMKVKVASRPQLNVLSFMNQLVHTRYIMTELMSTIETNTCPSVEDVSWKSLCGPLRSTIPSSGNNNNDINGRDPITSYLKDDTVSDLLDIPSLIIKFQERAFDVAYHFTGRHPPAAAGDPLFLDDDVRHISIANWIETLVAWTVGNEPNDVARFLQCCWRV
jgi:hypothetical protein